MTLVRRNSLDDVRDPLALARNLLTWDPFSIRERPTSGGFAARFDVKETDEAFTITGDFPGVTEDDLDISLDGDVLSISGSRDAEDKKEGETYYVYERQYGSFNRTFRLPEHADADGIEADLQSGVLTVRIPKKPAAKPRKIGLKKGD